MSETHGSYDDRQSHPLPCRCGRTVSNRDHCRRWQDDAARCPMDLYHGRRMAQPDTEECE